jgi:phage shock protein PspC (stress-responsive transcriptional regulator)
MPLHTRIFIGLAVGVTAGVAANLTLGPQDARVRWVVEHFTNSFCACC